MASKTSVISCEVAAEFGEIGAFGNDIAIVEGEEGNAEQREHFEGDIGLQPRILHRLAEPWALECRRAEHVGAGPGEIVPIADGRAQMLGERLAEHGFVGLVMTIGQRIGAVRALEANRRNVAEETSGHVSTPWIDSYGRRHAGGSPPQLIWFPHLFRRADPCQ